ncbi:ubiquitin-protein ligase [Thelephora terrestris]|uniref:Anaphase-promoting complex subunit 2 n=1 Tax=Thelephora terrestris TaxID=56493 RepID=A0A9P6L5B7_9AGAM|nr:ubiquitin-protein ligase [Thelephora terrestris]
MTSQSGRSQILATWQEAFTRLNANQPGITGLMNFTKAWKFAREYLYPIDINNPSTKVYAAHEVRTAFEVLGKARRLAAIFEAFLEDMRTQQHLITRDVNHHMSLHEETSDPRAVADLVYRLTEWHSAWEPGQEFGHQVLSAFNHTFQTHVFSVLPASFSSGFKSLIDMTLQPYLDKEESRSRGGEYPADLRLWAGFECLGMLERYESLISSVCYEAIEKHVWDKCARSWAEPELVNLREWITDCIVPWMLLPYARGARNSEEAKVMLQGVGARFDFHMCKTLCDLRIGEIFDIIVDYPDSKGALQDLKECLQRVDQRSQLVLALRRANARRLLHPGADTKDILAQYVSIMRCLRFIDPPGVLLHKVADPIRKYLRGRPDTIRCIVANLVGDKESGDSLADVDEPVQPLSQVQLEDYSDPNWEPEPIDAGPDFRKNKPSDTISTLVSIYDSKDLFVKELQVLLAQRLLLVQDGNFDNERRNIEILKVRFGEAQLQVCEVMLKDMTDSKRIDQHIQTQNECVLHSTIISRHFWPPLQGNKLIMPTQFKEVQDQYANGFAEFKPDKKLHWLPQLGTITLEVELQDRTIEAEVTPLEAAVIGLFGEKDRWTTEALTSSVGGTIEESAMTKALNKWVNLGVIKENEGGEFILLEIQEEGGAKPTASRQAVMEEAPSVMTVEQQQAEQMKVYWRFIEGMLTNLGSLPLDRIQTMLRIAPGYDKTVEQLAAFMEAARREGLVTVHGAHWKLNR